MPIMIIPLTPAVLWLLGFALIVAGASRFGWAAACLVGGAIILKGAVTFHTLLTKGWSK